MAGYPGMPLAKKLGLRTEIELHTVDANQRPSA